jgi:hypothetical protein
VKQHLKMVGLRPVASAKSRFVSTKKRKIANVNVNASPIGTEAKNMKKKVGPRSSTTAAGTTPMWAMATALRIGITVKSIRETRKIGNTVVDLRNIMRGMMAGNARGRKRGRKGVRVLMEDGNGMI